MKALIKNTLKSGLRGIATFMRNTRVGSVASDIFVKQATDDAVSVTHNGHALRFSVPNRLCRWRAETFSSKELETLGWIDAMPDRAVLWDVGANVGLYTVYAAKVRNHDVYVFEPSVFNLEILARKIFLNDLGKLGNAKSGNATIVPVALSDRTTPDTIKLTTSEWGGSIHIW